MSSLALFTDLYELTMAASYFHHRMFAPATFSLFVRKLPPDRGFLDAVGLTATRIYASRGLNEYEGARLNQPFMNRSFATHNEIKDLGPYF